jgi:Holliday junction resolvasome RuvABC endonuclease subunit
MPRGPKSVRLPGHSEAVDLRDIVVGVDASPTGTGLVALRVHDGSLVAHGRLRVTGGGTDRLIGVRTALGHWLSAVEVDGHNIVHVCMEGYSFGSSGRAFTIAEVGGTIKLTLLDTLGRPVGFPSFVVPGQVKKFSTGSGTQAKDQITVYVYKKWGEHMPNNDEADAYVLAQVARSLVLGRTEFAYEAEVIAAMKKSMAIHAELPNEEKYALTIWR